MSKWKNLRSRKGYLLLEAVASILIISIGLAIILRSFTYSLRASKIAQEYFVASLLLKDKMWELEEKQRREEGIAVYESTEKIPDTNYTLKTKVSRLADTDPLDLVELSILWQSGKRNEKIETATFMKHKKAALK